jgi:hypothetical protein
MSTVKNIGKPDPPSKEARKLAEQFARLLHGHLISEALDACLLVVGFCIANVPSEQRAVYYDIALRRLAIMLKAAEQE